jgi:hypothetical protein
MTNTSARHRLVLDRKRNSTKNDLIDKGVSKMASQAGEKRNIMPVWLEQSFLKFYHGKILYFPTAKFYFRYLDKILLFMVSIF